MSGEGLAQRLVTAAVKAITQVPSATWSTDAQAATVAVLRELAEHLRLENGGVPGEDRYDRGWGEAYEQAANDLEAHADSLEGKPQ